MNELILTNNDKRNLRDLLIELSVDSDMICIATAFFSETDLINDWLNENKSVDLLVSLRPPTNYYSLKKIFSKVGLSIQFLGEDFHSKFYIFYKNDKPYVSIIGSSNHTNGGLINNIETNVIIRETEYLEKIDNEFKTLIDQSYLMQPTDLDDYKTVFDNFQKRAEQSDSEQRNLQNKILTKRTVKKKKVRISKEATDYYTFWRIVDEIKDLVQPISEKEYPKIPVYITIDHFWHWIKTVWIKENRPKPNSKNRHTAIPRLFQEYCDWDKQGDNYTTEMAKTSKNIFSKLLSSSHIDVLSKEEAKTVFSNMHSGAMRTRRFGADDSFIKENSIKSIRKSLKYLLYSNDELDLRIHNLCKNPDYKLSQINFSGTQEIIGWVNPKKHPIRNDKANKALKLLGYEI
ncbi:MAG TPA: phospholipase D family protein [Bacteroidales bacterium]|nr:phospholipase D family protein [Bacteroidales bacterium]HRX95785.1 phospholipase D family protein [Bacteroidales bacterium]